MLPPHLRKGNQQTHNQEVMRLLIKIQIFCALIINLLMTIVQKRFKQRLQIW
jgi:hypothetical protein